MAFCIKCGTKLNEGVKYCPKCGQMVDGVLVSQPQENQSQQQDIYVHARKSKGLAMTLCFFGGWCGLHKFYLREYLSGSLYLIFCWTLLPLIGAIIDFVLLLLTPKTAFHRMYDK
ncbi:MAG: TM2 domain-containing protein [Bacteroidaceae bacterium]|jgi:TM2 domain-containing membrane protein YozV|nr:TM2 domain-containing protein [Bacteroidaceae bacterium]